MRKELISVETLTLPQMLSEMDTALAAEIKAQVNKPGTHTAINGKFITELSGQYLYIYDLKDLWEPQDDTPVIITFTSKEITATITNSTGTTITITTEELLPDEALRQISLKDDSTQLLKRLREVLKNNKEGEVQLGSKSFGLQSFTSGRYPSPVEFGTKFRPDESQEQAIQVSLGSEVTYIIGPPGTGKTSTLAAIAFAHLQEGHTVLIAAHTNIAIDNAVMKLADICKDAGALTDLQEERVIRYGTPQLDERLKSEYGDVHLPTIVKRRVGDLNKQREGFQTSLKQIEAQLKTLNEKKEKNQLVQGRRNNPGVSDATKRLFSIHRNSWVISTSLY